MIGSVTLAAVTGVGTRSTERLLALNLDYQTIEIDAGSGGGTTGGDTSFFNQISGSRNGGGDFSNGSSGGGTTGTSQAPEDSDPYAQSYNFSNPLGGSLGGSLDGGGGPLS